MDDGPHPGSRSRDESCHNYDLSDAVYDMLPSRATDTFARRSRAASPTQKPSMERQGNMYPHSIPPPRLSLCVNSSTSSWVPQPKQRGHPQTQRIELHQSTCLNLNTASNDNTESDLWILPDFDDWEFDTENPQQGNTKTHSEWAPLLRRAANSNLERLRARLEGDGWAFVGGKYEEDKSTLQEEASQSEESVDEEFDVVILPARVAC